MASRVNVWGAQLGYVAVGLALFATPTASAVDPQPCGTNSNMSTSPQGSALPGHFAISATASQNGACSPPSTSLTNGSSWSQTSVCSIDGDHICRSEQLCPDGQPMSHVYEHPASGATIDRGTVCPAEQSTAPPTITSEMVLRALRRIELPIPKLGVQPPGGKTLVNLETIFSTEADAFTRTLTLVGQRVTVELTPASYTWHHGDDTSQTTDGPGRAYERGLPMGRYITHTYARADVTVRPTVTTTWTARFRTPSQGWQAVDGTVSVTSAPSAIRVVEATPLLVQTPR